LVGEIVKKSTRPVNIRVEKDGNLQRKEAGDSPKRWHERPSCRIVEGAVYVRRRWP